MIYTSDTLTSIIHNNRAHKIYGDGRYGLTLALTKWALQQMAKSASGEKTPQGDNTQSPVNYTPNLLALMPPEYKSAGMQNDSSITKSVRTVQELHLGSILNFCRLLYPSSGLLIVSKIFEGHIRDLSEPMRKKEIVIILKKKLQNGYLI